jgi:hypothetical protein
MQHLREQLNAMHDLQLLLQAIHQLRAMQQDMAPVLHEVQAWQRDVLSLLELGGSPLEPDSRAMHLPSIHDLLLSA